MHYRRRLHTRIATSVPTSGALMLVSGVPHAAPR